MIRRFVLAEADNNAVSTSFPFTTDSASGTVSVSTGNAVSWAHVTSHDSATATVTVSQFYPDVSTGIVLSYSGAGIGEDIIAQILYR